MNELKFRAWIKATKKMVDITSMKIGKHVCYWDPATETDVQTMLDWNEVIILQYVGIDDENNKEIYDGDIVQYDTEDGIVTAQIIFKIDDNEDAHISGFYTEFISMKDYPEDNADVPVYFTVIGNILANPELMDKKNEGTSGT